MHGSVTCTMAFDGAKGWLVGKPNQGIQNMFVMMNLARIMVGFQGLGLCELATQNAINYARERVQGKAYNGSNLIVEHPDVRRTLMHMKAITEGGRVLAYEISKYLDLATHHADEAVREEAQDWVELLTPIHKAFLTDSGVELASMAIQVYGGHGYISEHGIEQIARDAKICCLYEGTNGIQAMDLARRKLLMHNGRLPQRFFDAVNTAIEGADADLAWLIGPLAKAVGELKATTDWIQNSFNNDPNDAGAGAADYLRGFALTLLGYNWLRTVQAVAGRDDDFARAKRATAKFFAQRLLPEVQGRCEMARAGSEDFMSLSAAAL